MLNPDQITIVQSTLASLATLETQQQAKIDADTTNATAAQAELDAANADIVAQKEALVETKTLISTMQSLLPAPPV